MAKKRLSATYAVEKLNDFSGGLSTDDPVSIDNTELVKADNVEFTTNGKVKVRPGCTRRFANDFSSSPVIGIAPYYKSDGTNRLVMASGTSLYVDNPHLGFNYDTQADFTQTGVYTNLDTAAVPGDVRMLEVLEDGFEDGTFGRWTSADSGWSIDTTVYKTGTRSAKGTGTYQTLVWDMGSSASVYVRLAVRFAKNNQQHSPVMFKSPTGALGTVVMADSDGHFKYWNGTAYAVFSPDTTYAANTWYTLEAWFNNGNFWVSINGVSVTLNGLAFKDTSNNPITSIKQFIIQNASGTTATTWVDDVYVLPKSALFTRSSVAYKSDNTQVTANVPRYEDINIKPMVYTEDTQADFASGTLTQVTAMASGDLVLATEGTSTSRTETTQADFQQGTLTDVVATSAGDLELALTASDTFTKLADPSALPTGTGYGCAFDPTGTYLAVAHGTSPYITIYKRSGDTFTKLANPSTLPTGTACGCAFDPTGTYLAVAHYNSPYITIYKRSGDTFTKLADPSALPTGTGYGCAFDPTGTYLAVAHYNSPYITIYKRSGGTFTKLANPSALPPDVGLGCAFDPTGTYLAVAHGTSPYITIYKRSGDTFTKLANPSTLPTGTACGCAFDPTGTYLAVAHYNSPRITIYKRSGGTFTKLANPSALPTDVGRGCAFDPTGTYLAVAHGSSPYITIYKRSGDTFTKLANPSALPTGTGYGCAFDPTGTYLAVAHYTSPYITIYKTTLYYASSGNRISPALSLSGIVSSSSISWNATVPTNTALVIKVSLDNGTTWSECTNGGGIPGITAGMDLTGKSLLVKQELSTTNTTVTPSLHDITVTVGSPYKTSGNRVSPTVPVALLGQAQTSSITWTADTPASTTLTVEISWDNGATWLACTNGGTLPGISGRNLISASFLLRESLSTTNTSVTPKLSYLKVEITGGFGQAVMVEEGTTNLFPSAQALSFSSAWTSGTLNGTYTVSIKSGTGSLVLSGGASGTVNAGSSLTFSVTNATVTFTPSGGTPEHCLLEQKAYATSWIDGGTTRSPETLPIPGDVLKAPEGCIEIYANDDGLPHNAYVFDTDGSTGRAFCYRDYANNTYKVGFNGDVAISVPKPATGLHYIAIRWSGTDVAILIDGVLKASVTLSKPVSFSDVTTLYIGSSHSADSQWDSLINDLRISIKARADAEISAAYSSGLPLDWDVDTTYLLHFDGDLTIPPDRQGVWQSPAQNASALTDQSQLTVFWQDEQPYNAAVACQVRTSADGVNWSMWYSQVNGAFSNAPANKYSQVRFIMQLLSNAQTPVLHNVAVNYGTPPSATLLRGGMATAQYYTFAQLVDNLIICNGADVPKKYDGTNVTDITNAPRACLVCVYKNRVFMAKSTSDRSSIWFSGIQNVDDWTSTDAGVIKVNVNDGDEIMAMFPTSMTLIIAKKRTTYFLQGYSPDTFQISTAGEGGTISPWGIVWTPYGIFRLDNEGVWITDFRKQTLLTRQIQSVWDGLNHSRLNQAALLFYNDKLLVSVADGTSNYNNLILVYDLLHKAWSVWRNWYPGVFTIFEEYGRSHYLFGASNTGNVYELGGGTDNGSVISGTVETRHMPFISEEFLKRFKWVDVYFGNPSDSSAQITVDTIVDGNAANMPVSQSISKADSVSYRVYPPAFGYTLGIRVTLTGSAVLQGATVTYYPRAARPGGII